MTEVPSLSEQQLVDCNVIPNMGCYGGKREFSFNYTQHFGLTTAEKYPYTDKMGECEYKEQTDKVY
jgi:hypothetical protein